MAIYLPGTAEDQALALDELTPREIVAELDKYVVGQNAAKRAVAIALRNRMRRQKLTPDLADEIMPKNIIMIGPTGVGKTEIARRLAKLTNSPFLKVEASKFTEVGYVGRDVESIVRDLVEIAIDMVREEKMEDVEDKAEMNAEERLLDVLLPPPAQAPAAAGQTQGARRELRTVIDGNTITLPAAGRVRATRTIARGRSCGSSSARASWTSGMVEIDVRERNPPSSSSSPTRASEEMDINLKDMLPDIFGQRTKKRKMKVAEAFEYLVQEEEGAADRYGSGDAAGGGAGGETRGLSFWTRSTRLRGAKAGTGRMFRREGVQRDILPIVEGTTVNTQLRDGADRPHSVHRGGRVPCVEAERPDPGAAGPVSDPRGAEVADGGGFRADSDGAEVVTGEGNTTALLETEGLKLEFTPEALAEMAQFAFRVNETTENIGARRLHTIMERVLDEISFSAPDLTRAQPKGDQKDQGTMVELAAVGEGTKAPLPVIERETANGTEKVMVIDPEYVRQMVADIVKNQDLSRYIL